MGAQQISVGLDAVVDVYDFGAREQLHHEAAGDDWTDSELHAGAAVGRHDDPGPVEGVAAGVGLDAIERQLATDEKDEQRDGRVNRLLLERHSPIRTLHVWQNGEKRPHQRQQSEAHREPQQCNRLASFATSSPNINPSLSLPDLVLLQLGA